MTVDDGVDLLPAVSRLASRIREAPTETEAAAILRCALSLAIARDRASSQQELETLCTMEDAARDTLSMLQLSVAKD